jgi:hypothetical protein
MQRVALALTLELLGQAPHPVLGAGGVGGVREVAGDRGRVGVEEVLEAHGVLPSATTVAQPIVNRNQM